MTSWSEGVNVCWQKFCLSLVLFLVSKAVAFSQLIVLSCVVVLDVLRHCTVYYVQLEYLASKL